MQSFEEVLKRLVQTIKQSSDDFDVVGKPVACADGSVILPISKISVGFAGGCSDVENGKSVKAPTDIGGGGVSIIPVGFLICGAQKRYIPLSDDNENKWLDFARSALNLFKKEER